MMVGFFITLREGLEAALVVGIVLGVLRRLGRLDQAKAVWAGVLAAVLTSVVAGLILNRLGIAFEGRGEAAFEGFTMLVAAGVLTWMIFWMQQQGRQVNSTLEQSALQAAAHNSARMLFGLSFVAVVREGLETALFLSAAAFGSTTVQTLMGGVLGLLVAVALGWAIYVGGKRLNLRAFFRATSIVLLLFAAGLLAHGVHELQEAALLPLTIEHVWNLSFVLDESGTLGSLLKALFGYNAAPSLLEVISYITYLLMVGVALVAADHRRRNERQLVVNE